MNRRNILHTLFAALLLLMGSSCASQKSEKPLEVIPQPQSVEYQSDSFTISPDTKIYTNLTDEAHQVFNNYLESTLFTSLKLAEENTGKGIQLNLVDTLTVAGNEAYRLVIDKEGAIVSASTEAGLFYGLQTILQLLDNGDGKTLPAVTIDDAPRFPYRGMHIDVSRHFFDKEMIKKQLDAMAYFKMNRMHWHLVDGAGWRIEIKKYPRLTEFAAWRPFEKLNDWWTGGRTFCEQSDPRAVGGYYTQEEIREVVAYAADRHITIKLEIRMHIKKKQVFGF